MRKPLEQSILKTSAVFILALSLLLAIQSYVAFSRTLTDAYSDRLRGIVTNVRRSIDIEDLRECIHTGVPSARYDALQERINEMVDDYQVLYIYLCIPLDNGRGTMRNVVSSVSTAEREAGDDTVYPLLYDLDGAYTPKQLAPYLEAWKESPRFTFFYNSSDFGSCYTACLPVVTPDGETLALCCADASTTEMRWTVGWFVLQTVLLTLLTGAAFGLLLRAWLKKNVIGPVLALEESTRYFALKSHEQKDPERLTYFSPDIRTNNELESLAASIEKMTADMKEYVENIFTAESWARRAQEEARGMSRLAYQDALTHMKSKAAYDAKEAELAQDVVTGEAEFALVMVDLNNLKKINDTYGHENGNRYIIGACKIIGDIYRHSPVYRIGGDEFIIVLQREDYRNRDALLELLAEKFRVSSERADCEPWERFSAAYGQAEYTGAAGEDVDDVFREADARMYACKKEMKATRE